MFTLRCTRKLLKRLSAQPTSAAFTATTVLGDWYANLLYTRPQQLVIAMSERSLLCVLVPAAPGDQLRRRLEVAVSDLLLAIGVPPAAVTSEAAAMEAMAIGTTASQRVLGCMNDAVSQLRAYPRGPTDELLLRDAELHLAENMYSLTNHQTPWCKTLDLFGVSNGVVHRPRGPWQH
jgi:hypothetical protein